MLLFAVCFVFLLFLCFFIVCLSVGGYKKICNCSEQSVLIEQLYAFRSFVWRIQKNITCLTFVLLFSCCFGLKYENCLFILVHGSVYNYTADHAW